MRCIYIKSAIYAEYQKTIFFATSCPTDGTLEKLRTSSNIITDYLARNGAPGYTIYTADTSAQTPQQLTLRSNPTLCTPTATAPQPSATLAAIIDADYTQDGQPIVEILVTDIPPHPTTEELLKQIRDLIKDGRG